MSRRSCAKLHDPTQRASLARQLHVMTAMIDREPRVVVLAGGEGRRLAPLTRALYGNELPKQFAVLAGARSLMQTTIERALAITSAEQISVVVTAHHEAISREQLAPFPGVELVVQPRNLDTGPGLLLPLIRILAREPDARVVFLPSDHYMSDDAPLVAAIANATRGELANRVTLIGVEPTGPEVEYGWIVPGKRLSSGARAVDRFAEKPGPALAEHLFDGGALWNTFISTGPASRYWELARRYLPQHVAMLERYSVAIGEPCESRVLCDVFRDMAPANFSHDLLAHADSLAVIAVRDTGWSDWGSPARVFASLVGTPEHGTLLDRIRGDVAMAG